MNGGKRYEYDVIHVVIEEKEARGEILVIRPPESLGISRTEHDPNELERVYQTGRREACRMLPEIRSFLKL